MDDPTRDAAHNAARDPARLPLAVDRASPVPLYFQLARQLEAAIEAGALASGSLLGNEIELAARLGLSRPTVRQAIQSLVEKGMLVRRRGVGTQVVHTGSPARWRSAASTTTCSPPACTRPPGCCTTPGRTPPPRWPPHWGWPTPSRSRWCAGCG